MNPSVSNRKTSRGVQECLDSMIGELQPGDPGSGVGDHWIVDRGERFLASGRVVTELLDVQETSVGGEADLAECGQVGQSFPDLEIPGVVDGGLGPQGLVFLVALLDRGVFVVDAGWG